MSTTPDRFPTEVAGLPESPVRPSWSSCPMVTSSTCGSLRWPSSSATRRVRMLAYNGSIPGPDAEGAGGLGDRRQRRQPGRPGGDRPLARAAPREPLRRNARDAAADAGRRQLHRPRRVPRSRASTGTTRTSARTTARRWASTATSWSSRPTPTTGRRLNRELALTLDDILLEDGKVAPFSRTETTHAAMGRFGNVLLVGGETDLSLTARRGEVVRFYLTNTANTRVFKVALPGARMKLVGGDSGHVEREEFVDEVDPGAVGAGGGRRAVRPARRADARAPHAGAGLSAGHDHASARSAAEPSLEAQFETLRTNADMVAERERIAAVPGGRARQDAGLHRRDGHGRSRGRRAGRLRLPDAPRGRQRGARPLPAVRDEAAGGRGSATSYTCPMHPEVVSERARPLSGVRHEAAAIAARRRGRRRPRARRRTSMRRRMRADHDHAAAGGIEWEDDMVEVNRMTTPANMRWKLIDRETGAENAAIDWRFRVGDRVKIRLLNEMAGDHPMHHPFHIHGAGRFLILARDGVVEPNLVWKDTVLVRTGRDGRHPARRHQPRPLDGPLPHRRAPRERDDVLLHRDAVSALADGVVPDSTVVGERMTPKAWWTLAITSVEVFMVTLDNLVVTTAIPVIREDLHASLSGLQWTVNAYTLTFAVLLLTGAALGDRFGRRRLLAIGIAIFTVASAAAALAPSILALDVAPGRPGCGRRDRHAADADRAVCRCPREPARRGVGHLGRHQRSRGRVRAARRRRGRQRPLLALDLLAQRSDRAAARAAHPLATRRDARSRRQLRSAGTGPGSAGLVGIVWGRSAPTRSAGPPADHRCLCRRRRAAGVLRSVGAAHRAPDAPDALLRQPDLRRWPTSPAC